ncbi:phage tail tape measure protein [Limnobaculum xujianqingii]|uniref:phage tail tape measure protein n=1 Tax=Limnobaculum xujianqingii TaxID=2738837 RepID=UPI00112907B6|nr:phage tail tape measure protein [Limnobaculum xujianqingii]
MSGDFKASMTLTADDQASKQLSTAIKGTTKAVTDAEKAAAKAGNVQKKTAEQSVRSTRTAAEEFRRAAKARENLGIRSEQTIQREIAQTIASYNRLAKSGVMSAREQERAYGSMKQRVRELKSEMQGVGRAAQRMGNLKRWGGNAMSLAGGLAAGAAVIAKPISNQMTYERSLTYMANTAFGDEDLAGRRTGRQRIGNSIRNAVTSGGGTKEDAADALNTMLASGAVTFDTAEKWLPLITKYATASGASSTELAGIAVKAKQAFGVKDEDMDSVFNMAFSAGKGGSFELRDMAKWLAQQMANASKAGMKGLDDFSQILVANEMAAMTAGSNDEAGNNVANLLAKLTSADTIKAAEKIKVNGKGIDLVGTLVGARERGINPLEAFSFLIDDIVKQDKRFQALQKKLAAAKSDEEKTATLESMSAIVEGSALGQLIADQQATKALVAYRYDDEYKNRLKADINAQRGLKEGERAGDLDFQMIAETPDFKVEQAKNVADFAQMDSIKPLSDAIGNASSRLTELGVEYPELAAAAAGAATAIQAMTAAALAFAGMKFLTGGGGLGGAVSGAAAGAGAESVVDSLGDMSDVAGAGAVLGGVVKLGGLALAVTSMATFNTDEEEDELKSGEAKWAELRAKYGQNTIDAAREKYQPWYQIGSGYAAENEQWIQQYLQDSDSPLSPNAASVSSDAIVAALNGEKSANAASTQAPPPAPLNLTTQLMIDGQMVAELVNQYNVQDGTRTTGGANY